MSESLHFFEKMKSFSSFQELLNEENYIQAPTDWWVVITDVKGSTQAIESGRYKDVNTVGAATLAAIQNAMGGIAFPFVFGGDGATALIPNQHKEAVERELSALRATSRDGFKLELRVGIVSVTELESHDKPVLVAKYCLKSNYPLAMFKGGALTKAEELIKAADGAYEIADYPGAETDLGHLSCRWQPMKAKKGVALSLLFVDPEDRKEIYDSFISQLDTILDGDTEQANPVNVELMRYRNPGEMLAHDQLHQRSLKFRLPRMIQTLVATVLFGWGLFKLIPNLRSYVANTAAHSDFRKFDDMLRMVLDATPKQADAIRDLCESLRSEHGICFGIHLADAALMTCYVPGLEDGAHIHFIDGHNGGYAIAAKELKAQLKALG